MPGGKSIVSCSVEEATWTGLLDHQPKTTEIHLPIFQVAGRLKGTACRAILYYGGPRPYDTVWC